MLLQNLRAKLGARLNGDKEAGFTLIELLVVMLILGILAAIALPAFFNQKDKANDAKAKEYVHSAQVAMETYGTEHSGKYPAPAGGLTGWETALKGIEPTLSSAKFTAVAPVGAANEGYTISIEGTTGHIFIVTRLAGGALTFTCTPNEPGGAGGCPAGGNWENG
jgi:type IV pilus assembly protein PilA